MTQTPQALTALHRHRERERTGRNALDDVLDACVFGTLATVVDGLPWAVPLLHARDGDRILLHGSTGAGALRQVADGAPVAFTVAIMDALVVGHTTFSSSANYRSAVVRGTVTALDGEARAAALDLFSDKLIPGRVAEVRPMNAQEKAATLAMELPIADGQWIVKARTGQASRPEEETGAWTGIVPVLHGYGTPVAAPWSGTDAVPESVRQLSQSPV